MRNRGGFRRCRWSVGLSPVGAGGVVLAVFVLLTSSALGAGRDARERTARTACLAGDWAKGVGILSQLFVETEDANYIYNQGRCFEQNARYTEAIARFQEYLLVGKKLRRDDKAEAERRIQSCKEMLASQAPATVPPPVAPAAAPAGEEVHPAAAAVVVRSEPPRVEGALPVEPGVGSSPGKRLRTAGVVMASVGGVALVAGLLLNLKVNSMASDFTTLNGYTDGRESDRETYETLGWVGYGLGAACVATGAVLYVLGRDRSEAKAPSVAVAPSFARGGAAAVLKGAF